MPCNLHHNMAIESVQRYNVYIRYGESASDLLLFPSKFEGLGIVLIEAQSNGIPIVCSSNIPEEAIICDNVKSLSLKLH